MIILLEAAIFDFFFKKVFLKSLFCAEETSWLTKDGEVLQLEWLDFEDVAFDRLADAERNPLLLLE